MRMNWSGLAFVAFVVAAIISYKTHMRNVTVTREDRLPTVLLVADLSEADSADPCAQIIHAVRAARERGIPVQELNADSKSEILRDYHVLTIPTVLILDRSGQVVSRFEGEDLPTVAAIRNQLDNLH